MYENRIGKSKRVLCFTLSFNSRSNLRCVISNIDAKAATPNRIQIGQERVQINDSKRLLWQHGRALGLQPRQLTLRKPKSSKRFLVISEVGALAG